MGCKTSFRSKESLNDVLCFDAEILGQICKRAPGDSAPSTSDEVHEAVQNENSTVVGSIVLYFRLCDIVGRIPIARPTAFSTNAHKLS